MSLLFWVYDCGFPLLVDARRVLWDFACFTVLATLVFAGICGFPAFNLLWVVSLGCFV